MFSKKAAAPTVETLERHSQFVDIWRRLSAISWLCSAWVWPSF